MFSFNFTMNHDLKFFSRALWQHPATWALKVKQHQSQPPMLSSLNLEIDGLEGCCKSKEERWYLKTCDYNEDIDNL